MNIQSTKEYMDMHLYKAVEIAESMPHPDFAETEEERSLCLAAWQYLVDTGIVWLLQGWFGRNAQGMIDDGIIGHE